MKKTAAPAANGVAVSRPAASAQQKPTAPQAKNTGKAPVKVATKPSAKTVNQPSGQVAAAAKPAAARNQAPAKPAVAVKAVAPETSQPAKPAAAPKTAKAASAAPAAQGASKSAAAAAAKPAAEAKTVKAAPAKTEKKAKKAKVVRDSFTMPETDYGKIALLKKQCQAAGVPVKKSELLRAGLQALQNLPEAKLLELMASLENVKTGRPSKV